MTRHERRNQLRGAGLGLLGGGILLAITSLAVAPGSAKAGAAHLFDHRDDVPCQTVDHRDETSEAERQASSKGSEIASNGVSDHESCPTAASVTTTTTTALVRGAVIAQTTSAPTTRATVLGVEITRGRPRTDVGSTVSLGQASIACVGLGLVLLAAARLAAVRR